MSAYENAPSLTAWESLTEDEQIEHQEEMTKILEDPDTLKQFSEACKNIGQTAVAIDENFRTVQKGFNDLVEKYGADFPDVGRVYVPKWAGFMARWNGDTGMLWSSRKLAAETAASLTDYGINLALIADIQSQDDLEGAQMELKQYVEKHPVEIATRVSDQFKDLRNDIGDFSKDFTAYIEEQKQKLTEDAAAFEADILKYQAEIAELNEKIKIAGITLGFSFIFGVFSAIPAGFLIDFLVKRGKAQENLNQAQANLARTIAKQAALAAMQADFEKLKPNIDQICNDLGVFASVWAFATEQTTEINIALDEGMEVLTRKKFIVKLNLLIAQIEPLKEGMRQYATQITPPSSFADAE
ncbi:hypothetical protein AGABI2DRAFT_192947 [Agaricus bisporus var. bisporus H97]|uniref:hypothetical protein n=1 Tax=Agaricus bisporus var. bisporus (strain H97 / ATCC MYA-4626 / FGSC 10389) TaxID=936046 RepID=UPI00029F741B|nr:hypothetical protein AGABI2DRAFT_192947 [Agaricus bisporus var. bisporus H97]EKV47794.1 hypothetical protein AGABI2DRAFT_192947 [Agaricus bisporus var. bisporus H97]